VNRRRHSYRVGIAMRPRISLLCTSVAGALWIVAGCGSPTDAPPAVSTVLVTSPVTQLVIGETTQLFARLQDAGGNVLTGRSIAWTSSNTTLASVSAGGLVSGRAGGPVTITATSEGHSGSASLTIVPAVASVTVNPPRHTMPVGSTVQLTAIPRDASGSPLAGRIASWSSSNQTVASVSATGVVTAHADGPPATITATVEGRSGSSVISIGNPCGQGLPIAPGQSVTGELAPGDCMFSDGSYADPWLLTVASATGVEIDLESTAFNAFLAVTRLDGTLLALDNDGGEDFNARVEVALAPGSYVVWANSLSGGETGAYALSLTSTAVSGCGPVGTIAMGDTVTGSLATSDCLLYDGTYADGWEFTVGNSTGVVAELASNDFDAFVIITDAQGNRLAFDDDSGPLTNSQLRTTLPAGTYRVWANSFYAGETGSYTLSLRADACRSTPILNVGDAVTGSLASDDCRLTDGSYADRWAFTLGSATTVRLDLASDAFDPYLVLTDTANNVVASDDDSGPGSSSRIEAALPAGSYLVWANTYAAGQTGAYSLAAASVPATALNLRIDGLYLTQSIQRFAGTVPLVKNRPAYLRVFGRASIANTATPPVRVRVYNGTTLRQTLTLPATSSSVTTLISEGTREYSWNVLIDGSHVQPGLAISAEIDPDGAIPEADETDNGYPSVGALRNIDVRDVPRFDLTLVPVRQSTNGLVGRVDAGNKEEFVDYTRRVFPLDSLDVVVRPQYTTTLPALQAGDDNGSWSSLLAELNALRVMEGGTRTYYGVVRVSYNSGLAGLGYIGRATALGWDYPGSAARILAHELGHTFGRFHSPCGGAGGPDPNYPYANGAIGLFGYDRATGTIIPRTAPDLMSYCNNEWVSDYTYEGILAFRTPASPATSGMQAARPVLVVWGTVEDGKVVLEPAFHIVTRPSTPGKAGPWSLVARDAEDQVLFSYRFDVDAVPDAKRPSASFAFALPADSAVASRIHSLTVVGPAGESRVGLAPGVRREAADRPTSPAVAQRVGDRLTLTWDRGAFPLGLVRDTRTGRVLSIVRGGRMSMPSPSAEVELLLSDGVRTTRQRVDDK
jgi:hypothetical protein